MTIQFKLSNIKKIYGKREVLNIEHLEIESGYIYSILGPNGSGKTTLLRNMALLNIQDQGDLYVLGEKINWSKAQLLRLRTRFTMLTQSAFMFEGNVYYNMAYGLKIRKKSKKEINKKIDEALKKVGMTAFKYANANNLSGGERQKVAIARSLTLEPEILFLDEPTSNIDPGSALDVEKYIRQINQENKTTIILVTHNLFQAQRLAEKLIILWDGKIIENGDAKKIFANPQDSRSKSFLSGESIF